MSTSSHKRNPRRLYNRPIGLLCDSAYTIEQIVEVSEQGLMFRSDRPLRENQCILVNFFVPKSGLIIVSGVIQWLKDSEKGPHKFFGVVFGKLQFEQRRALRSYIAEKPAHEKELEKTKFL